MNKPRGGRTYNSETLYRDLVNDRITMADIAKVLGVEPELYEYLEGTEQGLTSEKQ